MTINWEAFTPWSSLGGGVVIGLAVAALLLLNGKIAGISGVLGGLLRPRSGDFLWRAAFVLGLVAASWIYRLIGPLPALYIESNYFILSVAGVLVGLGTRYGSGCTSGHGVCGLSRLSIRSSVATMIFMTTGFATVYVVRHLVLR